MDWWVWPHLTHILGVWNRPWIREGWIMLSVLQYETELGVSLGEFWRMSHLFWLGFSRCFPPLKFGGNINVTKPILCLNWKCVRHNWLKFQNWNTNIQESVLNVHKVKQRSSLSCISTSYRPYSSPFPCNWVKECTEFCRNLTFVSCEAWFGRLLRHDTDKGRRQKHNMC